MSEKSRFFALFGAGICTAIIVHVWTIYLAGAADTSQTSAIVGNATPEVTAVVVNNGSSIVLTPNTTTTVQANFTISDDNGCGDVFFSGFYTLTLYRSGEYTSCVLGDASGYGQDLQACYDAVSVSHNCPFATTTQVSGNATATFEIWYFADATDASSSYPSEAWEVFVTALDASSTSHSATSTGVEMNTLLAISVPASSLAYGSLAKGENTSSTNQASLIKNAGNSSTSLRINGTAMTSGSNAIPTSSQHFATSSFTFGGNEQQLQGSATDVTGFTIARPPLTSWATTTPLPSRIDESLVLVYNNFLYAVGGEDEAVVATTTVLSVPINATGSLGSWTNAMSLPSALKAMDGGVYNSFLYAVGGLDAVNVVTSTVFIAPVSSTGTVGAWATSTPLPFAAATQSAIYNNYIYAVGGCISLSPLQATSTVVFAPISTTGTVGSWVSATALPHATGTCAHSLSAGDGYLYVIGGFDGGANITSTVVYAPINATGSLGSWTETTRMPFVISSNGSFIDGGLLYNVGGEGPGFTLTSTALAAPIRSNGALGAWTEIQYLPNALHPTISVGVHNGNAYFIGGETVDSGNGTTTVLYAPLATKNTYWGMEAPTSSAAGTYQSTVIYTAVFSP